jgi:hypothetical protein
MTYSIVKILSPFEDDNELREALMELEKRNLILFDRLRARYDLHQVIREYAYKKLENKIEIHKKLKDYLSSVSDPKIVKSLGDLTDLIELYHHTVNCGLYDDAIIIFQNRLCDRFTNALALIKFALNFFVYFFPMEKIFRLNYAKEKFRATS